MKKNYFLTLVFILISAMSFGQASDLFISMYAEGSSNNKFIEIYNGTGSSVDLSKYMMKGSNNGGDWKPERDKVLTGTLADGDVYVIAADAADASILAKADLQLSYESVVHYNGDDAVGLFKDDGSGTFVLLDVIGVPTSDPGSGWDVAGTSNGTQNHTLTRKSTVCGPNTDWAASAGTDASNSEWVVTAVDTEWASLGSYTGCSSTASVGKNTIEGFSSYPNPVNKGLLTVRTSNSNEKEVSIYNVIGKRVFQQKFSGATKQLNVSHINSGIYIMKVIEGDKVATKKLVIQ